MREPSNGRTAGQRLAIASITVVVATLLTGCTSGWERYSNSPEPEMPGDITRPIDTYMWTADEIVALVDERETQINGCLTDAGIEESFSYPERDALRAFLETNIEDRVTRGDAWGFFDPSSVDAYGYQRAEEPVELYVSELPAAAPEGCSELLRGADDPILRFSYASLPEGGPALATSDERVIEAIAGWSACMSDAGWAFSGPLDPLQLYAAEAEPSKDQLATAHDDLECKRQTNLIAAVLDVQQELDDAYISEQRNELEKLEEARKALHTGA